MSAVVRRSGGGRAREPLTPCVGSLLLPKLLDLPRLDELHADQAVLLHVPELLQVSRRAGERGALLVKTAGRRRWCRHAAPRGGRRRRATCRGGRRRGPRRHRAGLGRRGAPLVAQRLRLRKLLTHSRKIVAAACSHSPVVPTRSVGTFRSVFNEFWLRQSKFYFGNGESGPGSFPSDREGPL